MKTFWIALLLVAWIYPIQAQVPITQEMIRNPVQTVLYDLGSVKIYGKKAGKETGFIFVNTISNKSVEINFDAYLTGNGTECFQRKRDLQIGEIVYELDTTIFNITISDIVDTINFKFTDGCASGYVGGQGWDNIVNVALDNFTVSITDTVERLYFEELRHWMVEVKRLHDNLNMEGCDTLIVDSTGVVNLGIKFVQPLTRTPYDRQPDPVTYTRGDTLLDWNSTIDPNIGIWADDSAYVNIVEEFETVLGNWAWTGMPVDTAGLTAKQCNWQWFRVVEASNGEPRRNPPSIMIRVQMEIRKK